LSTAAVSKARAPRLVVDEPPTPARRRPLKLRVHSVLRWLHIYTSVVSLAIVLFFGVTGVTLNHPSWLATESTRRASGQLSSGWKSATGVDWLVVAEQLRAAQGVHGTASDRRADSTEASITFKAPGYSAECSIDMATGAYDVTIDYQGLVGVLNDLHRGRDAGTAWAWVIDATGLFLTLISATGLGLLVYLKKVRAKALLTMAVGAGVIAALALAIG